MKISYLDKLRGISILLVFTYHCLGAAYGADNLAWNGLYRDFSNPPFGWTFFLLYPFTYGWSGVALFFVISGFCIHLSFAHNPSWKYFFRKRFFRIYPPYLVALLLVVLWHGTDRGNLISHLFLYHNTSWSTFYGINGAFWTIAVEFQLYLIYPVVFLIANRWGWKTALFVTGVVEFSIRLTNVYLIYQGQKVLSPFISASPFAFWFSWSLGAYVAEQFLRKRLYRYNVIFIIAVYMMVIGASFFKPFEYLLFPLVSLGSAMLISNNLASDNFVNTNETWIGRHLVVLGVCSYSFYLLHNPIVKFVAFAVQAVGVRSDRLPVFLLTLPSYFFVLFASILFYKWIEQNSIKLGRGLNGYFQSVDNGRSLDQ